MRFDTDSHPLKKDCVRAAALLIATGAILEETVEVPPWIIDVVVMDGS